MKESDYDVLFNKWIELRNQYDKLKLEKNYRGIIEVSEKIIGLSKKAPDIGIMVAIFEQSIAEAYVKLEDVPSAIIYYKAAKKSFEEYRATKRLRSPDDYLSCVEKIQKKLAKLETK